MRSLLWPLLLLLSITCVCGVPIVHYGHSDSLPSYTRANRQVEYERPTSAYKLGDSDFDAASIGLPPLPGKHGPSLPLSLTYIVPLAQPAAFKPAYHEPPADYGGFVPVYVPYTQQYAPYASQKKAQAPVVRHITVQPVVEVRTLVKQVAVDVPSEAAPIVEVATVKHQGTTVLPTQQKKGASFSVHAQAEQPTITLVQPGTRVSAPASQDALLPAPLAAELDADMSSTSP